MLRHALAQAAPSRSDMNAPTAHRGLVSAATCFSSGSTQRIEVWLVLRHAFVQAERRIFPHVFLPGLLFFSFFYDSLPPFLPFFFGLFLGLLFAFFFPFFFAPQWSLGLLRHHSMRDHAANRWCCFEAYSRWPRCSLCLTASLRACVA